jgi:two-component system, OmpR family, sensor kinase
VSRWRRPPTLRREIVLWYSLVLVVALGVFTAATHLLLQQALERAGRASLRQTAQTVEQLTVPPNIPRVGSTEEIVHLGPERVETLRRQTRLATGDVIEIFVARSEDVETRALQAFLLIALLLIPITAIAAALGGRALLDRLLYPLHRLVDATRQIEIGGLSRRVLEPERPTELRDLAQAFNGMLMRLEGAVGALRRFTADASHELRTPLTSIKGTVQVALARPRSAEELEDTLVQVAEEADWMLHLVDGLLTLARGEEQAVPPVYGPVDLPALLSDVSEMGQALAAGRPIELETRLPDVLMVRGSASQLRQVFLNLVSNAVKFTEAGRVSVCAQALPPGAGPRGDGVGGERGAGGRGPRRWALVQVRDTGVGIAPKELPRVFDRFYRGEAARAQPGGTGLGLAIAKLLVEQHGGEIEVESVEGEGSEFRIYLPLDMGAPVG